jgi:hypothetical protein
LKARRRSRFTPILSGGEGKVAYRGGEPGLAYCRATGIGTDVCPERSARPSDLFSIDTAVAATLSETVSVTVAISSIAIARRLDKVCSACGGPKPGLPVSSAMMFILRINQISRWPPKPALIRPDLGGAIE